MNTPELSSLTLQLSMSLTHFDVISRSHAHTSISHALALVWKVTLLFWPSEVLVIGVKSLPSPSIERVNVPGFNKLLVHFWQFEKCKIQKSSGEACPFTPLDEAHTFSARLANELSLWKTTNLRALTPTLTLSNCIYGFMPTKVSESKQSPKSVCQGSTEKQKKVKHQYERYTLDDLIVQL